MKISKNVQKKKKSVTVNNSFSFAASNNSKKYNEVLSVKFEMLKLNMNKYVCNVIWDAPIRLLNQMI